MVKRIEIEAYIDDIIDEGLDPREISYMLLERYSGDDDYEEGVFAIGQYGEGKGGETEHEQLGPWFCIVHDIDKQGVKRQETGHEIGDAGQIQHRFGVNGVSHKHAGRK